MFYVLESGFLSNQWVLLFCVCVCVLCAICVAIFGIVQFCEMGVK